MKEKKIRNTISQTEHTSTRRVFIKQGVGLGTAVFFGGLLMGNFTGCAASSKQTKTKKKPLTRFAHITDTHVTFAGKNGVSLFEDSFTIYRDIIAQVNEMNDLDFVLFGGDNINNTDPGTKDFDEFMDITSALKIPYFVQFGNRESSPIPPGTPLSKNEFAEKMNRHGLHSGRYWWSISPVPGIRVLGIDTSIVDHDNGEIPTTELEWIKKEIDRYPNELIITLSHHLFVPTWVDRDIPAWRKKYVINNYQDVGRLLENAPQVKICLMGHHHVSKVQTFHGLHYIASPATIQYPHAFRTVTIDGNEARLQFHQVRDQKIIELGKDFLLTSKNAEEYSGGKAEDIKMYCHGSEFDNFATLKLR